MYLNFRKVNTLTVGRFISKYAITLNSLPVSRMHLRFLSVKIYPAKNCAMMENMFPDHLGG